MCLLDSILLFRAIYTVREWKKNTLYVSGVTRRVLAIIGIFVKRVHTESKWFQYAAILYVLNLKSAPQMKI